MSTPVLQLARLRSPAGNHAVVALANLVVIWFWFTRPGFIEQPDKAGE
jgi:hypothetical protein